MASGPATSATRALDLARTLADVTIGVPRFLAILSTLVLLFSLVASGQIKLRKLDGFEKIAAMLNATARRAA